ncbi:hypothetical protein L0V05_12035 [Tabrizicola sp. J26]|uniref:hypothetical protein n=1 Tax=Alitabrizicola rongguiensis TaxID=2909234 RepID=UPI001F1D9818|nr:hypothetical protein [Tabrizicola rongguiensis]MCF1709544.1 hypothetical protein [Tabrizicola rongguiensis]
MKRIIAPLLASLALSTPLYALDLVPFGTSGAWQIFSDPNHGNNCVAQVQYDDGSFLRLAFLDKATKTSITSFSPAWKEFKLDHKYDVAYQVDDAAAIIAQAKGIQVDTMPGVEMVFETGDLFGTLVTGKVLTFIADGNTIVQQSLDGSADAIEMATACEAAQK